MEKGRRDTVLLTVIGIATLLVAIVGATFAYFTAQVSGTNRGSTITITASAGGSMTYYSTNVELRNIYPNGENNSYAWATKPFRIDYQNANAQYAVKYKLSLRYSTDFGSDELSFTIAPVSHYCLNDMSKTTQAECEAANKVWTAADNTGAASSVSGTFKTGTDQLAVLAGENTTYIEGTFAAAANGVSKNQTHAYELKIYYNNDTSKNQNSAGQGKAISAYVEAVESTNG